MLNEKLKQPSTKSSLWVVGSNFQIIRSTNQIIASVEGYAWGKVSEWQVRVRIGGY